MSVEVFLLLVCVPLGLALLCAVVQGLLAVKLNGEILRALLLGLLPIVCVLAALYALLRRLSVTGWDQLEWEFYLVWAGSALAGALVGWLLGGRVRLKKRKPL